MAVLTSTVFGNVAQAQAKRQDPFEKVYGPMKKNRQGNAAADPQWRATKGNGETAIAGVYRQVKKRKRSAQEKK